MTAWLLSALLIVSLVPQSADLAGRSQAAAAAMQKGSFDEAARMYQELVRAVPGDAGLLMNLGMALAMGGNVRVGLEDSLWGGPGRLAQSNAEQVTLARKMIEGLGMEVATPDEARQILGLKGADKVAF